MMANALRLGLSSWLLSCCISLSTLAAAHAGPLEDGAAALDQKDYLTAFRILRPVAEGGNAAAQNWLGFMYSNGVGVPQNYLLAEAWYRKAAEQGYVLAEVDLGLMYGTGKGVAKNYKEAIKWMRLAADQGNDVAQYNLGIAYGNGFGVPQDYVQAHMWLNLAAANATEKSVMDDAQKNRDLLATKMTPEQLAEAQRLATAWAPK